MPRPPLALGTWGEIRVLEIAATKAGQKPSYRAIAWFRDYDGRSRQVERSGASRSAARTKLTDALKLRAQRGSARGGIGPQATFRDMSERWLTKFAAKVDAGQRSPSSLDLYRRQLANHIWPALGALRLGELNTPVVDDFLEVTREKSGVPTARTCRSVLSNILGLAVRLGAIVANPVREVERIEGRPKKLPRALTGAEALQLLRQLMNDPRAIATDIVDLVIFMLATGVRIGEALAVWWSEVNWEAGTVAITSTIIRIKGKGLIRKDTKSKAGQRVLVLPTWALRMLRARNRDDQHGDTPIFPDSLGGYRDPSNTRRILREVRGDAFSWLTSHNFRKTVATEIDRAGLSARDAANQLGHAQVSMTDHYFDRTAVNPQIALALEAHPVAQIIENHG